MNLSKARDFYSAYYEGSLDLGLRQAFDRALTRDAELSAEYRQFIRIMQELNEQPAPVEVPADLHLKVREKLDANILAIERKARTTAWFFAWKPIAYGAVATAAIIGAVASFSDRGPNEFGVAGFGPSLATAPRVVLRDGIVRLQFGTDRVNTITVTNVATGEKALDRSLVGQTLDCPITNVSDGAAVLLVSFAGEHGPFYVAVPGAKVRRNEVGAGTGPEFVGALADMYAAPVVVDARRLSGWVEWRFDSPDILTGAKDELRKLGLKAEMRENGLVWLSRS